CAHLFLQKVAVVDTKCRVEADAFPQHAADSLARAANELERPGAQRSGPPAHSSALVCHLNCCGLRPAARRSCTVTSPGPLNFIAPSSAAFRSLGSVTKKPLPPNASIILS